MRSDVYRAWQWFAAAAALWFAVESGLHVAFGDDMAAMSSMGMALLAVASAGVARMRRFALANAR